MVSVIGMKEMMSHFLLRFTREYLTQDIDHLVNPGVREK